MDTWVGGLAAIAVAILSASVAIWGTTPRRTRRLRDKAQILAALPPDSEERDRLLKHVDRLVHNEIIDDRGAELQAQLNVIAALGLAAWVSVVIARDVGGLWWYLAGIVIALFVMDVVIALTLLQRWYKGRSAEEAAR